MDRQTCHVARCLSVFLIAAGMLPGCGSSDSEPVVSVTAPSPAPAPQPPPAATYMVSGVVTEAVDGEIVPLQGVHVEDSMRHSFVTTDAEGSYSIPDVGAGAAYIYFAKEGFQSSVRQFALGGDTRLDVQMTRDPQKTARHEGAAR